MNDQQYSDLLNRVGVAVAIWVMFLGCIISIFGAIWVVNHIVRDLV